MPLNFDHFVYAARDLDPLVDRFRALSGVAAGTGGRHPGLGTRNALASLGGRVYLELMATDPQQSVEGTWGAPLLQFDSPRLFFYMLTGAPLEGLRDCFAAHGIACRLFDASRQKPDGSTLRWRLLLPESNPWGMLLPNAIDWLDSAHPAASSTPGCRFQDFEIGHPQADGLNAILADLGADFRARRTDRPSMRLRLGTPAGPLELLN